MKFFDEIEAFFKNTGENKLFLSIIPAIYAFIAAADIFNFNSANSTIIIAGIMVLSFSVKFLDDFIDWTEGKTFQLKELEQTGMRGRFDKAVYFYEKSPRKYFYGALIPIIFFIAVLIYISICQKSPLIFLIAVFIPILGYINYSEKTRFIVKKTGSEFFTALLCSVINMILVFFAGTKYISSDLLFVSLIVFFFIFNICYISSILNLKTDIMTEKTTFAVFVKNQSARIFYLIFFTMAPFVLAYTGILLNIFPKTAYFLFLLIPHSIWLIYLVILYEKAPQKQIKWNILMGPNKDKISDEQNNLSWYNVRYSLARNIFCAYMLILMIIGLIKLISF